MDEEKLLIEEEYLEDSESLYESDDESILLYEYDFDYSQEEAYQYIRTSMGDITTKRQLIICAAVTLIGLILSIWRGYYVTIIVCIVFDLLILGFPYLNFFIRRYKYYNQNKQLWSGIRHVQLYNDSVSITGIKEDYQFIYDDFYKVKYNDTRIYLIAGGKSVIVVDRSSTPQELQNALITLNDTTD